MLRRLGTHIRNQWMGALSAAAVFGALALGVPIVEAGANSTVGHETNCISVSANPKVPRENIDYLLPPPFRDKIAADSPLRGVPMPLPVTDLVQLALLATHCEAFTIGDSTRETTWATLRVPLAGEPDENRAQPPLPPHLDDYELWIASDNPKLVQLWRREGGAGRHAVYVKDLVFDLELDPTGLGGSFEFVAPEPTPSPFRIVAKVSRDIVGPLPEVTLHHYGANPRGWMVTGGPDGRPDAIRGVRLGMAKGRVFAKPGSQLDRVFCDDSDGSFQDLLGTASFEYGGPFTVTLDRSKPGFKTPRARCP